MRQVEDGMKTFVEIANEIGSLVSEKNLAYGDSFSRCCEVMKVLYPSGIPPEKYTDALLMVRIIDKLFRIANKKDAFGESPWGDIAGYGILGCSKDQSHQKDEPGERDFCECCCSCRGDDDDGCH